MLWNNLKYTGRSVTTPFVDTDFHESPQKSYDFVTNPLGTSLHGSGPGVSGGGPALPDDTHQMSYRRDFQLMVQWTHWGSAKQWGRGRQNIVKDGLKNLNSDSVRSNNKEYRDNFKVVCILIPVY